MVTKTKHPFPALKTGGYSTRFRFMDEGRGERYFDTEWAVRHADKVGFYVDATMRYDGFTNHGVMDQECVRRLGQALTAGTQVLLAPRKWTRRGARYLGQVLVTIKSTRPVEGGGIYVEFC